MRQVGSYHPVGEWPDTVGFAYLPALVETCSREPGNGEEINLNRVF